MLLFILHGILMDGYQRTDSWCFENYIAECRIAECRYCFVPPLLTIAVLILYMAKPAMTNRKGTKLLPFLLQCASVGCIMYAWESLLRPLERCTYYFGSCAVAVLCCALILYTLALKPWVYLVPGGIFAAWGVFELFMGESIYFDSRFTFLFMEAGTALVICGFIVRNRNKAQAEIVPVEVQAATPLSDPVVTPESESIAAPETSRHKGRFCRHCGAKLEDGDIYCVECGNKVS